MIGASSAVLETETNWKVPVYHSGTLGIQAHNNVCIVTPRTSAGTEKCREVVSLSDVGKWKQQSRCAVILKVIY